MKNSLIWRGVFILAIVAMAGFSAYPLNENINLGLDLKGGIHLVLEVVVEDAFRAETDKDMERLVEELEDSSKAEAGTSPLAVRREGDHSFVLTGASPELGSKISDVVDQYLPTYSFSRQGADYVFERRPAGIEEIREQAVRQALTTINNRIDEFGVAEPVIQRQGLGSNRIVVQLPGVDDPERVKRLIKNTAFLEFRLVDYPLQGRSAADQQEILTHYGGTLPDNVEIFEEDVRDDLGAIIGKRYYALEKTRVITGRDLKTATSGLGQFNEPVVNFSLTYEGSQRFGKATGENVGRGLAIVLDGKVQSAPNIESKITNNGVITGINSQQEVDDLVTVLKSGALPAGINYLEERTVGPSLGQDSIDQGLRAGELGVILVILTMLVVYKGSGVNAIIALVFNFILVFGALAYFGATLTLPGIAGIILTIGMAVDANVLIFERIREELHHGRTVKSAVASGFAKALSSIFDANITTLIAAIFLFQFGTGPIRGFAVTLTVGIMFSVFTAVFNGRWLFDLLLSRSDRVEKLSI